MMDLKSVPRKEQETRAIDLMEILQKNIYLYLPSFNSGKR